MKKILSVLVLMGLLGVLIMPITALAVTEPADQCNIRNEEVANIAGCPDSGTVGGTDSTALTKMSGWGVCCTIDAVYTVFNWMFVVLIAFVGIMIVYGGVMIVTAGGDAGNVKKGRDAITYAVVGFAVALLARAIPSVVASLLGM